LPVYGRKRAILFYQGDDQLELEKEYLLINAISIEMRLLDHGKFKANGNTHIKTLRFKLMLDIASI